MRDPVARRQLGAGRLDAIAVHPATARPDEQRAGFRDQPDAEPSTLEDQTGSSMQRTLLVANQVAEQAERDELGITIDGASRAHDVRAPSGVELGDQPRLRECGQRDGECHRIQRDQQRRRADEGNGVTGRRERP